MSTSLKTTRSVLCALACGAAIAPLAQAGQAYKDYKDYPIEPVAEKSRWSVSVGANAREVKAGFKVSGPRLRTEGPDPGLFGRRDGTLVYRDGALAGVSIPAGAFGGIIPPGIVPPGPSGIAFATVESLSQVSQGGNYISPLTGGLAQDVNVSYTSERHSNRSFTRTDDEVTVSPYIALRYDVVQQPGYSIGALGMYSFTWSDHNSGWRTTGTQVDNTYIYPGIVLGPAADLLPPPFDNAGFLPGVAVVVVDPAQVNQIINNANAVFGAAIPNYPFAPRKETQVTVFRSRASVDVDLHEIVLAAEFKANLGERVELALAAGPTLNIIDWQMDSETVGTSNGRRVFRRHYSSEDTELKIGVMTQGSVIFNLDAGKRFFLELHGGYRWVDDAHAQAGPSTAQLDLSSWTAGAGAGVRF